MTSRVFKVGIYFSHYECFGHTSRVMAVGEVFKKRFPFGNLFFIQAGIAQPKAKIDQLGRVYLLPKTLLGRHNFRKPIQAAGFDAGERSKICRDIIIRERPDLFITELFPLGREESRYELIPSLIQASKQGAVLWAVAGYPLLIALKDNSWRQKILKLYQRIIILSPSREKEFIAASFIQENDRQEYLDFFERNKQKITFAGYLLPQREVVYDDENENLPKPTVFPNACRVTVVRGGGAVYPKIIAEAILASDLIGKEYDWTVVAGPATTSQEWRLFSTLVRKKKINNLVLRRSAGNYEALIEKSDVCVSVASYHSAVMLMKHRKKAIVIPFEGYGKMAFSEQSARAGMLKKTIGSRILSIDDLTADTLARMVRDVANSRKVNICPSKAWFRGESVLSQALTELFLR